MMEVKVYDVNHSAVGERQLSEKVFECPINENLLHGVVVGYLANKRQGTAAVKGRSDVKYSSAKLYRQKGTGRARQGSLANPIRRGGGVIFGPQVRSYRQNLPKKVRQEALRVSLSDKAREEKVFVVKGITLAEPKTKEMVKCLESFEMEGKTLVIHEGGNTNLILSLRNLPDVCVLPVAELNALVVLQNDNLLITEPALEELERIWG